MTTTLKPGTRLLSAVCTTEVVVVRAEGGEVALTIGGVDPIASGEERTGSAELVPGHDGGALTGKRYVDPANTVELLCTKAGPGMPAIDGTPLLLKSAKPLPASD